MSVQHANISRSDTSLLSKALRGNQAPKWRAMLYSSAGTQPIMAPRSSGVSAKPWERLSFSCGASGPSHLQPRSLYCLPSISSLCLTRFLTSGAETGRLDFGWVSLRPGAGNARGTAESRHPALVGVHHLPPVVRASRREGGQGAGSSYEHTVRTLAKSCS